MDYVLEISDDLLLDRVYEAVVPCDSFLSPYLVPFSGESRTCIDGSLLPRGNIYRQYISVSLVVWLLGVIFYFLFAPLSYWFLFDKRTFKHPRYLRNQIRMEISLTMAAMPVMSLLTAFWFVAEIRGYSKLYGDLNEHGLLYLALQLPLIVVFSDCLIYFIHRGLHHRLLYKHLHKPHHRWIVPTPFASHAFHPLDGYVQSLPYHIFPFLFPLNKLMYLAMFVFINLWTIMIHDGEAFANNSVINGAACHTVHHLYYRYNYGQFTTLWDRLGGSYRKPDEEICDPTLKMASGTWTKQVCEVDQMIEREEDGDDRTYQGKTLGITNES
ncbi:probable Delta(7)-sterol 5(6)-desaturase [Galendromus occidentalis]|uniref:Probable Delta(7)-sterol 5(6)-desaturase n=1 Tax=Galendromus occidentalis TaxID=34638 RepID=A0AAJ6VV62_9ACAR|nr:probable Delta(7)-sterol 5(6)-desaturase [Galendromus occidentalis]